MIGDNSESVSHAQSLYKASSYRDALKICETIYITRPSDPDNLVLLGAIHFQLRNLSECIFYSQQCLRVDETCAEAYVTIGNCMREMGKLDAAVGFFHKAIRFQPRFPDAYNNLACTLFKLGKVNEAIDTFNVAITLNESHCDAICNLANVYKVIGKPNDAKNKYLDAIRIDPKCAIAWSNLGGIFYDNGDFDQAIKCYEHALAISPDFADASSNMGNALMRHGKLRSDNNHFQQAQKQYQRAQKIRPDFALAVGNMGMLKMIQDNNLEQPFCSKKTEHLLRKALLHDPNYYDALNNLAIYYFERRQFDESIKLCLRALKDKPDHYYVYHNLAKALKAKGFCAASAFAFSIADLLKDIPGIKCGLATSLLDSGKVNQALDVFNKCLDLFQDGETDLFHHNLGVANLIAMNTQDARKFLTHGTVCTWKNSNITQYNLSILFQRQGDLDNLMKCVQTLANTDDPEMIQCTRQIRGLVNTAICAWSDIDDHSQPVSHRQKEKEIFNDLIPRNSESIQFPTGERIRIGYIYDTLSRANILEIPNMHDATIFDVKHYPISYHQTNGVIDLIQQDMIQILVLLDDSSIPVFQDLVSAHPAPLQISFNRTQCEGVDYYVNQFGDSMGASILPVPYPFLNNGKLNEIPHRTSESVSDIRAKYGINDDCFVYASFSLPFNIEQATFKTWMSILRRGSESSILLLMRHNAYMEINLKREAETCNIDPNRLVFIDSISSCFEQFLLVDLYLDTLAISDNDTLCEALLLGTPTLCYENDDATPILMKNLGLGDLLVSNTKDYENLALQLEHDEDKYIEIVKILDEEKKAKHGIFDDNLKSKWISSYEEILKSKINGFFS